MSWRGLVERGRPPFFTTALDNISSVSSGSSLYSDAFIVCASDFVMSDPEVRREADFFAAIGFSHAEYVAGRTSWGVAHDDQPSPEQTETYDPTFPVILAQVFDFDGEAMEHLGRVFEI